MEKERGDDDEGFPVYRIFGLTFMPTLVGFLCDRITRPFVRRLSARVA